MLDDAILLARGRSVAEAEAVVFAPVAGREAVGSDAGTARGRRPVAVVESSLHQTDLENGEEKKGCDTRPYDGMGSRTEKMTHVLSAEDGLYFRFLPGVFFIFSFFAME